MLKIKYLSPAVSKISSMHCCPSTSACCKKNSFNSHKDFLRATIKSSRLQAAHEYTSRYIATGSDN
jgi:hypothetical protein